MNELESVRELLQGIVEEDPSLSSVPLLMARLAYESGKKNQVAGFLKEAAIATPEMRTGSDVECRMGIVQKDLSRAEAI